MLREEGVLFKYLNPSLRSSLILQICCYAFSGYMLRRDALGDTAILLIRSCLSCSIMQSALHCRENSRP